MLLFLMLILVCCFSGDSAAKCSSGFPLTLTSEEDLNLNFTQLLDSYTDKALYLFPELKFHCETNIERIQGYFLADTDDSEAFYIQIWRKQNFSGDYIRIAEINLNFSAHCENNNDEFCFIDYPISDELEVEIGDFVGFYTENNTLARPLFSSSESNTQLYLFSLGFRLPLITERFIIKRGQFQLISYHPQVIVFVDDVDSPKRFTASIIVGVSVFGSCVIMMAIVILAVVVLYKKRLKSMRKSFSTLPNERSTRYQRYIDPLPVNRYYSQVVGRTLQRFRRSASNPNLLSASYASVSEECDPYEIPFNLCSTLEKICTELHSVEVSPEDIVLGNKIGSGQFGTVSHGVWHHDDQAIQVAIKTLHGEVSEEAKKTLLKEAAIIRKFAHTNIVKLYGVVTNGDPVMILFEYLPKGDLLRFLVSLRSKESENLNQLVPSLLLGFARDIGRGMNYLSNKCFIHRDLAARNILLSEDCTCKIADFGMSRDLENDYYIAQGGVVPVKWTAPEALLYRTYITASDVWSYGVVLYEMWSVGQKPFGEKDNSEVMALLHSGYRLPPPPGCPRQIYNLMIQCWNPMHKLRPNFSTLLQTISQPPYVLFHWIDEDKQAAGPQCDILGAPLECGHNLYLDLQNTYKINNTAT